MARKEGLIRHTFIDFKQTSEFLDRPLVFERADGLYVWDQDGRQYFDAIGGIFVAVLGHRHPRVVAAVRRQLDRMTFAPPGINGSAAGFGAASVPRGRPAARPACRR